MNEKKFSIKLLRFHDHFSWFIVFPIYIQVYTVQEYYDGGYCSDKTLIKSFDY